MTHYLLAVYHAPGAQAAGGAYPSEEAMQEAFRKVETFNQSLNDAGHYVYACGLEQPEAAGHASVEGQLAEGPLHPDNAQLGGFWVVEAGNRAEAQALTVRAAEACGQPVELRPMQGA